MATFVYQARTINGQSTTGKIVARDENDARIKLRAKQLITTKLSLFDEKARGADGTDFEKAIKNLLAAKIKSKELQIFTRQFSTLINAGIPIADSLRILADGATSPILKQALTEIQSSIQVGKRLSESMIQHPQVFDPLYCNMIQAGEEAGIIDTILMRLSVYLEKNEKIKSQVRGALVMPIIILIVAVVVISGILIFIIPKFQEFYSGSGKSLPALTQMMIDISTFVRTKWYVMLLGLFSIVGGLIYYIGTSEGKINFDKFVINSPLFGDLVQKSSVARMSRTLSTLLSSGIGLIEAIDIASKTAGNYVIEQALLACKESVTVGKPFNASLLRQKEIPRLVTQMVGIGEQSGALDTMLGKIADFYEEEVENAVKALTTMIEPLMMVFIGGIIALVLVAMYLPIFNIGDTIG